MKILHINTERTWRGGEQQTLNLLAGLNARRVDSDLVCQPDSPMQERADGAGINVFRSACMVKSIWQRRFGFAN